MTFDEVKALIRSMTESGVEAIDLREGAMRLRIVRGAASMPLPRDDDKPVEAPLDTAPSDEEAMVVAPLSGTFYRAESPGKPPFVEVGATVAAGDTMGLIEAMKMLTPVTAGVAGIVAERAAEDGSTVEAGAVLFTLAPSKA